MILDGLTRPWPAGRLERRGQEGRRDGWGAGGWTGGEEDNSGGVRRGAGRRLNDQRGRGDALESVRSRRPARGRRADEIASGYK